MSGAGSTNSDHARPAGDPAILRCPRVFTRQIEAILPQRYTAAAVQLVGTDYWLDGQLTGEIADLYGEGCRKTKAVPVLDVGTRG